MDPISELRKKNFVLWRPGKTDPLPKVFIGQVEFDYNNHNLKFTGVGEFDLYPSPGFDDLWLREAEKCNLDYDKVYYYWFKVGNSNPYENNNNILYCTDPFATVVDDRFQAKNLPVKDPYQYQYSPASVVYYHKNGTDQLLFAVDPENEKNQGKLDKMLPNWEDLRTSDVITKLKPNNQLVIYELPALWSTTDNNNTISIADGNFRQVEKMIACDFPPPSSEEPFMDKNLVPRILPTKGLNYIEYLGINALELTPPANCSREYDWGYGTANYMAPSFNLSRRADHPQDSNPATDFVKLVKACHKKGIRFFYDAVMAFSVENPYRHINYLDFFVHWKNPKNEESKKKDHIDPEEWNRENIDPEQWNRDGFGGDLVKYKYEVDDAYNPNTGKKEKLYPSREYLKAHLFEWIKNKGVSGLRLDSVVNFGCYDFLTEIKKETKNLFNKECGGTDDKFLVVAEELAVPSALITQERVDGQWNERFKQIMRNVILGQSWGEHEGPSKANFEWSVKKLIDCRCLREKEDLSDKDDKQIFFKGTQAVNYLTSHDVGGFRNERFFSFLVNNASLLNIDKNKSKYDEFNVYEKRFKLAFTCLMTAIGIPMILAGDEFAEEQDCFDDNNKQRDPVNYIRARDCDDVYYSQVNPQKCPENCSNCPKHDWRKRVFEHARHLIKLRTTSAALASDNIEFIHHDFNEGKRVMVWKRQAGNDMVITVANFSDWGSGQNEYVISGWPKNIGSKKWYDASQNDRPVDQNWYGRESIFPWEAKVYVLK